MNFEFATATKIIFGAGKLREIDNYAVPMGKKALLVMGHNPERARTLIQNLTIHGIESVIFSVSGEPQIATAQAGVTLARESGCDLVIAFGGGSVLDSGKAIAILATNEGEPLDYLEVIGKGLPLKNLPLPMIAIPTTAGTGSEVTANAVLSSPEHKVKVSLRSPMMLPRLALVDPELTYDLPAEITASTGMDALTQVIEPFVSNKANPITDALCREGILRAGRALRLVVQSGTENFAAREDMALASLLGGMALANAKLGAVHGFAGVIGGMFDAPHGAVCAALLPYVMEVNLRALRERDHHSEALRRYVEIGQLLTGRTDAAAGVAWVIETCLMLKIPPLGKYSITAADIPAIVEKSANASSMKGNPIVLTPHELTEIMQKAL